MVTPESNAGLSEKMVFVAKAAFQCGMLTAGYCDLKYFLMGNLVDVIAH